jgi:hypothetical protein
MQYTLVLRVRPDGFDYIHSEPSNMGQGGRARQYTEAEQDVKRRVLWDCMALYAGGASAAHGLQQGHFAVLKRRAWLAHAAASINVCNADHGIEDGTANDSEPMPDSHASAILRQQPFSFSQCARVRRPCRRLLLRSARACRCTPRTARAELLGQFPRDAPPWTLADLSGVPDHRRGRSHRNRVQHAVPPAQDGPSEAAHRAGILAAGKRSSGARTELPYMLS